MHWKKFGFKQFSILPSFRLCRSPSDPITNTILSRVSRWTDPDLKHTKQPLVDSDLYHICVLKKSECGLNQHDIRSRDRNQFSALEIVVAGRIKEEGGRENFFSWKIRTLHVFFSQKFELNLCLSLLENSPTLIQLRGKFFKFKMTSVTHFHYELDTCPRLGLWIWQVSYTCQNSPISFPLGGKFKFWISFLPSL